MSSKMHRFLAAMLVIAMALTLPLPALAAPAMMGEASTVVEVPVMDTDTDTAEVGPLRAHSHAAEAPVVVEPEADLPAGTLAADPTDYVHSFDDGLPASGDVISAGGGSLSSSKGEVTINGVTIKQCMKFSSSAYVEFKAPAAGTLTLYFGNSDSCTLRLDVNGTRVGEELPIVDGKYSVDTVAGTTYKVTKDSSESFLFYVEWKGAHTHAWTWTVTKEPTCSEEGSRTGTCSAPNCDLGGTKVEAIPTVDHTPENVAQVDPTCITDGTKAGSKCSVCGAVLLGCEPIPATGSHSYGADGVCTACGVKKHDHVWATAGVITKKPTCTEPGEETFHCTVEKCEEVDVRAVKATGHTLVHHDGKAPTCTVGGWDPYDTCTVCDYTTYKELLPAGHKPGPDGNCTVCGASSSMGAGGWFETLFAELENVTDAQVTAVSYSGPMSGSLEGDDLTYLVRDAKNSEGKDVVRIDIPGLMAGTYDLTVSTSSANYTATGVEVLEYDRSGYAHFNYTDGVGGYRDDGILKPNAKVIYVTEENKDTVSVTSADGTTVKGIGNILNSAGQDNGTPGDGLCERVSKGKKVFGKANENAGIIKKLADDGTPLVVRIVGSVTNPAGTTAYDSTDYGGSVGDNGAMVRMQNGRDVTIEGIGSDATIDGWGIHFICSTGDTEAGRGRSFEVRNLAFRNVPEDCIGMEGQQSGSEITAPVERCWIHNCSFYAPKISNPAESDKDGGDGACDFKRGQYMTMSYCHYMGYHKTNLVGSSDTSLQYHITWHHDLWENCESRGPLGRNANMHIYNCIYRDQTSYCMNPRANCYIFSEYNTFERCKNPMQIKSGAIKSFHDVLAGVTGDQDGTIVTDKAEKVSSANKFASFELDEHLSYIPAGDYKLDTSVAKARQNITAYAGPMKAEVIYAKDVDTSVVDMSRVPAKAVVLPYDKDLNKAYVASSSEVDNIRFDLSGSDASFLKVGNTKTGQDIIFKVDKAVDISITDGGATGKITLGDAEGTILITGTGTAKNLPAGVYYLQSSMVDPSKGTFKEAKVSHLKITQASATDVHTHTWGSDWQTTVESTCTKAGTQKRTCTGCGEVETQSLPKLDHDYGAGDTCSVCGINKNGIQAHVHNWGKGWETVTAATCTKAGAQKRVCSECGLPQTQIIPMLPHTWGSDNKCTVCGSEKPTDVCDQHTWGPWEVDTPATCVEEGVRSHTCTKCHTGESETIPATGIHTYGADDICDVCGEKRPAGEADAVRVTGVTLNTTQLLFTLGGATTAHLTAAVLPANATNKAVTWRSSDTQVITVDAEGVVTAHMAGTATVTVTTSDGAKTASCAITVKDAPDGEEHREEKTFTLTGADVYAYLGANTVSGVTKNADDAASNPGSYVFSADASVQYDDYFTLLFTKKSRVDPNVKDFTDASAYHSTHRVNFNNAAGTAKNAVKFTTQGPAKVKVWWLGAVAASELSEKTPRPMVVLDATGAEAVAPSETIADNETPMCSTFDLPKAGTYYLGAKGGKNFIHKVEVTDTVITMVYPNAPVAVVGVDLDKTELALNGADASAKLTATVTPADAAEKTCTWTSSNPAVATVSADGTVTAVSNGSATVTVTTLDGGFSDSCAVTVTGIVPTGAETGKLGDKQELTWAVNADETKISITAGFDTLEAQDMVLAACKDASGRFIGAVILRADQLEGHLPAGFSYGKLIWLNADQAPKCHFSQVGAAK